MHHAKQSLILPNAWDVPSARVFEESGFQAIATSSAGVMVSLGYADGELISREEYFGALGRISKVLSVPLSADIVSGFGNSVNQVLSTVKLAIKAGAVGINIEDYSHNSKKLCPVENQVEKLRAIKDLGESMRMPLVINARTDALIYHPGNDEIKLKEAIRRSIAYRDSGADCVYPMRLVRAKDISVFVKALDCPVNVMIRKGLPTIKALEKLGVARISFGPGASYATMGLLKRISEEIIERGTFRNLTEGSITFDELNALASPRADKPASQTS